MTVCKQATCSGWNVWASDANGWHTHPQQDVSFQKICKGQAAPRAREKDVVSMATVRMLFICSESACSAMWDWPKSRRCSGAGRDDGDEQKHKPRHVRLRSALCRVAWLGSPQIQTSFVRRLWFGLSVSLSLSLLYTAVNKKTPLNCFHNTKQAFTHEQGS